MMGNRADLKVFHHVRIQESRPRSHSLIVSEVTEMKYRSQKMLTQEYRRGVCASHGEV